QQRLLVPAHSAQHHEQERRLADAGLAAHENEARRDEATAEDAVELRDARRDPLGLFGLDLDQAQERARGRRRRAGRPGAAHDLLVEAPERAAAGAAPEPARGLVPALRASMDD